jgi:hypothetical protein
MTGKCPGCEPAGPFRAALIVTKTVTKELLFFEAFFRWECKGKGFFDSTKKTSWFLWL